MAIRAKWTLLGALVLSVSSSLLALGCQTYDFEPVEPLVLAQTSVAEKRFGTALRPNLMLLVDTSGSMDLPVDPTDPDCGSCGTLGNPTCGSNCTSRWSALQGAMSGILTDPSLGEVARFGLALYPNPSVTCGGTTNTELKRPIPEVPESDAAGRRSAAIAANAVIQGFAGGDTQAWQAPGPSGGTPIGASLRFLADLPSLQASAEGRRNVVLLLTDGLPNCNPDNPISYQPADGPGGGACQCTLSNGNCSTQPKLGCVDPSGAIGAVSLLKSKGIETIVVGFGAESLTAGALPILNGMADNGGFARACSTNPDANTCGTDCNGAQECRRRFYPASNQAELGTVIRSILAQIGGDPCFVEVAPQAFPEDNNEAFIVVRVEGERVRSGSNTWEIATSGKSGIRFVGNLCNRITSATAGTAVDISVSVLDPQ